MGKMSPGSCAIVYDNVNQIQMTEWFSNYWKYKELNNTKFQTNSFCWINWINNDDSSFLMIEDCL